MTVVVPGVGVITRKPKWKQLLFPVEIPAARFSCLTSGSFRPKLGICILLSILLTFLLLVIIPYILHNYTPYLQTQKRPTTFLRRQQTPLEMAEILRQTVSANDKITADLLKQIGKKSENVVMSSFSLNTVMGMVLAGAKGNSEAQILSFLKMKSTKDVAGGFKASLDVIRSQQNGGNITLKAANRVYAEKTFQPLTEYNSHVKSFYNGEPMAVDFSKDPEGSRKSINTWVESQTNSKIRELLASGVIDSMTRMVLVNALYFKGDWAYKFDPKGTKERDFYVDSRKTVKVPMMHQTAKFGLAWVNELGGAMALRMPYKGEQVDMIFILPNKEQSLNDVEGLLSNLDLSKNPINFSTRSKVITSIPKFKVESTLQLNEPLKKLGVTDVFDETKADLSGISGDKSLFVSLIVQKAFVEVNEEGAEAAAATAAVVQMRMAMSDPIFDCNRPFYFMIKERSTGLVMFSGRVTDPSK